MMKSTPRMEAPTAQGLLLVVPQKADSERDAVVAAWEAAGGEVLRLHRFWQPPQVDAQRVRLYGNDTFCLVVAQKLDLELVSPPNDLLAWVKPDRLRRTVQFLPLEMAIAGDFPAFVKPVVPKAFR